MYGYKIALCIALLAFTFVSRRFLKHQGHLRFDRELAFLLYIGAKLRMRLPDI